MRRFIEYSDDNRSPKLRESEEVERVFERVELAFHTAKIESSAVTLYVTTQRLILLLEDKPGVVYDFDPQYIVLHAVTRDADCYPKPCIYCQLDNYNDFSDNNDDDDDEEDDNEDANDDSNDKKSSKKHAVDYSLNPSEMFLVPSDESDITTLFDALSRLAFLNPDSLEDGEFEGDSNLIYNLDDVTLSSDQARALEHLESVFHLPGEQPGSIDGQFDNA